MKDSKVLLKGLSKFVDERNIKKVRLIAKEFHPSDIYKEIENWPTEKAVLLLRLLKQDDAADLFMELSPDQQENLIKALTTEEISELFDELYIDEAVDILDDLPPAIIFRVLKAATPETRQKINAILRYEKMQTGYHMVVDYVSIPNEITIKEAKNLIKTQINDEELEIVGNIFVYNKNTKDFMGHLRPDDIFANEDTKKIDKFIVQTKAVNPLEHISKAENLISKYDLSSLPVVNLQNKLIGVIELDDIIEWYEDVEEATYEQAAIKVISKHYFEVTIFELFKHRIPWIVSLLLIGIFSQIIFVGFQKIWISNGLMEDPGNISGSIGSLTGSALAIFAISSAVSISSSISGAAGNTGSQTSSTLVRSLALGEIQKGNYLKALQKEFIVSVLVGITVMFFAFIRINLVWLIFGEFGGYGRGSATSEWTSWLMLIAFIASISFLITIVIGNFVGSCLPIIANKYNIDGALFSGPVQTTFVDILTILIYFSITTAIFVPLSNSGILNSITQF